MSGAIFGPGNDGRRQRLLYPTATTMEPQVCEAGPAQSQPGTKRAQRYSYLSLAQDTSAVKRKSLRSVLTRFPAPLWIQGRNHYVMIYAHTH